MPIKPIAIVLAMLSALALGFDHSADATVSARGNIGTPTGLIRGFYLVVSTTTKSTAIPLRLKDIYRTTVSPIDILDGDIISVTFQGTNTVNLGDPTLGGKPPDGLLMQRNRGKGPLGITPLLFPRAHATFNPRKLRLVFGSGHGIGPDAPRAGADGPVTVTIHRLRGGILSNFAGTQIFEVRKTGGYVEGDFP